MLKPGQTILVIEDIRDRAVNCASLLQQTAISTDHVLVASDVAQGLEQCQSRWIVAIFLELLPFDADTVYNLLNALPRYLSGATPPLIVVSETSVQAAVQAMRLGAADYLAKPELTAAALTTALMAAIAPIDSSLPPEVTTGPTHTDKQKRLQQQLVKEIDQRQQTEQTLHATNHKIVQILESMTDAFVALDPDWRITYINQAAAQINQFADVAAVIGKSHWEVWPDAKGTLAEANYRQAIAEQKPVHFEFFYEPRQRWYEIHAYPTVEGLGIYFQDIHDRKQTEIDHQRNLAILQAFVTASPIALALFDRDLQFLFVNEALAQLNGQPVSAHIGQCLETIVPQMAAQFVPLLRRTIEKQEPICQLEYEGEIQPGVERSTLVNQYPVCLPDGETIGVGIAITDISDLKQAKQELAAQEERYRYIFEAVNVAIWEEDFSTVKNFIERLKHAGVEDFRQYFAAHPEWVRQAVGMVQIRDVNQAALRMFRAANKAQLLDSLERIFIPETQATFLEELIAIAQGEPLFSAETVVQNLQGDRLYLRVNIAFPPADAAYDRVLVSLLDLTEQKAAETALAENEARLRGFVEAGVVGIFYGDVHGRVTRVNNKLLQLLGYAPSPLAAGELNWIELTPPEYRDLDAQAIAEAREQGACTPYEKELYSHNGQQIPVLVGFSLVGDEQDELVAFVLDLSERKQAELALSRSEDRLRIAMDSAQLGTWDWNLMTQELVWDKRCRALLGLSAEAEVTIESFFTALHPDDRDRITEVINVVTSSAHNSDCEAEFRVIGLEDGIERWISAKGRIYFNHDKTPRRLIGTVLDITERKTAEQVLQASEERLQMALEGSGGGLWDWDVQTDAHYVSPQWLQMLGYDAERYASTRSHWEALIHPEDRPWVLQLLEEHLADSTVPYKFEYRLRTQSGTWKWIANYGKVVVRDEQGQPLRMAGIHHDVSDRKQIQENLRLSEIRYRTLANAVSQLMWINDAEGQIEFYNQQWSTYTGVTDLQLGVGLWADIIHPEDFSRTAAIRNEAIQAGDAYEVECRLQRADGVYRWHLARILPLKDDYGRILSWFGTATDIHDRKCAETEREQLLQREQAAREEAERTNRIKDEFLAILSHELRSPLNPILGWSKLLQTRDLSPAKTAFALSTIERNAKLQTQLIDDLLDVARILRGKLKLENAAVTLPTAIEAAAETVCTAAAAKSITIRTECTTQAQVWGDSGRLQQVIWNLLSNAVKFTNEGGSVEVRLTEVNHHAQITVTDTGQGISPNFLPHIFKSFHQEDASITRKHGGLGLGLAIVRYLVEAHGGTITADSPGEGQGATFTVQLPLLSQADSPVDTSGTPHDRFDLSGVRILAIDDNPDACELLNTVLTQYGADVQTVTSAKEGLASLKALPPDVLISDIGMPDLDGLSLIQQIRQLPPEQGGQVPAIALTAYARAEDQQQALSSGYQKHLAKPIEIERVVQSVTELIHHR